MNKNEVFMWLDVAVEAARKGGEYLLRSREVGRSVILDTKKDIKIVADKNSEKLILDHLIDHSDTSILSEEKGFIPRSGSRVWIVDPLDGSLNYSRDLPSCCVSIGLWEHDQPLLGVVYDFQRDQCYKGIVGEGAWCNGTAIRSSDIMAKEKAVLCTGFPVNTDYSTDILMDFIKKVQQYKKIRLFGSAALSLAYVASGKADAYMENDIMIWDVAAGIALALAAGCSCDIDEGSREHARRVFVSNGSLK